MLKAFQSFRRALASRRERVRAERARAERERLYAGWRRAAVELAREAMEYGR